MKLYATLPLLAFACGPYTPSAGQVAGPSQAILCEHAYATLRADHDKGMTCEAASAHVRTSDPGCILNVKCPDAGTPEGGTK